MANPPTNQFLPSDLGSIGSSPTFQVPEKFAKIWAPTGLSLEEINRRREAVRKFVRELDTKAINFVISNTGGAATGTYAAGFQIPKNKKLFIYNLENCFYTTNTAADSKVSWGWANTSTGTIETNLSQTTLPAAVAGAVSPHSEKTNGLPYPIIGKEEQHLVVNLTNFIGRANILFIYFEDDVGISA